MRRSRFSQTATSFPPAYCFVSKVACRKRSEPALFVRRLSNGRVSATSLACPSERFDPETRSAQREPKSCGSSHVSEREIRSVPLS